MNIRDLTSFLAELSENNQRAWFMMNKPRYDILRAEFVEFVAEIIKGVGSFDPEIIDCDPKKAIFRINRDVRFSADKSPYKTTFSAALTASGRKKPSEGGGPIWYFHIDQNKEILIAAGEYMPPADRLFAIRQHIVGAPGDFSKVIKNKKLIETFGSLSFEEQLMRPPKGFDANSPHLDYLKLKSFIVRETLPLKKMASDDVRDCLQTTYKQAWPLVKWLRGIPL